jgi:hypothetical protein
MRQNGTASEGLRSIEDQTTLPLPQYGQALAVLFAGPLTFIAGKAPLRRSSVMSGADMRWRADTRLGAATAGAENPR